MLPLNIKLAYFLCSVLLPDAHHSMTTHCAKPSVQDLYGELPNFPNYHNDKARLPATILAGGLDVFAYHVVLKMLCAP